MSISTLSQNQVFGGLGSGQLEGEQLQYAVVTSKPREQESTHGHGSPPTKDCQCVFRDLWQLRRRDALRRGTRRLPAMGISGSDVASAGAGRAAKDDRSS